MGSSQSITLRTVAFKEATEHDDNGAFQGRGFVENVFVVDDSTTKEVKVKVDINAAKTVIHVTCDEQPSLHFKIDSKRFESMVSVLTHKAATSSHPELNTSYDRRDDGTNIHCIGSEHVDLVKASVRDLIGTPRIVYRIFSGSGVGIRRRLIPLFDVCVIHGKSPSGSDSEITLDHASDAVKELVTTLGLNRKVDASWAITTKENFILARTQHKQTSEENPTNSAFPRYMEYPVCEDGKVPALVVTKEVLRTIKGLTWTIYASYAKTWYCDDENKLDDYAIEGCVSHVIFSDILRADSDFDLEEDGDLKTQIEKQKEVCAKASAVLEKARAEYKKARAEYKKETSVLQELEERGMLATPEGSADEHTEERTEELPGKQKRIRPGSMIEYRRDRTNRSSPPSGGGGVGAAAGK